MHDIRTDAPPPRSALVVGAGIGGLSAALALRRLGLEVRVLERADALAPAGAGLTLWPNALRAFDALGVGAAVRAAGRPLNAGAVLSAGGRVLIEAPPAGFAERHEPIVAVHRADLQAVLLQALGTDVLTLGAAAVAVIDEEEAAGVRLADGTEHRADVLVAADGIASALRPGVLGRACDPRYAGATSWRGVAALALPEDRATETWGAGRRFGVVPLRDGHTYWFATRTGPRAEEGDRTDAAARLQALFAGWPEPAGKLLAATDPASIVTTDLEELPRLGTWTQGRAALLGDAAHAMTPNLGQGAAMAVEDAVVLARELGRGRRDVETALEAYNAARSPRVEWVVAASRHVGRLAQARRPAAVRARDWAVRATPAAAQRRRLERIVGFE